MAKIVSVVFSLKEAKTILEEDFNLDYPDDIIKWNEYLKKYKQLSVKLTDKIVAEAVLQALGLENAVK